jgi:hypothetical protein
VSYSGTQHIRKVIANPKKQAHSLGGLNVLLDIFLRNGRPKRRISACEINGLRERNEKVQ